MTDNLYQQLADNRGEQIVIIEKDAINNADQIKLIELREQEREILKKLNAGPFVLEKQWTQSTNIARTKYIPEQSILEVEFNNGGIYHYADFPEDKWKELLLTDSIGTFLARRIKGVHLSQQIQSATI